MWGQERRIPSFGSVCCRLFAAVLALVALPVHAHLLNMSTVEVRLLEQHRVLVVAQLDLTRAFGSAADYFAASQIVEPLSNTEVRRQLGMAADAIQLTAGDVRIPLRATDIEFVKQTLANYESPLEWPRASVRFEGALPEQATPAHLSVKINFTDGFVFEEPIATTLQSTPDELSVSRWLVTFQSSPVLDAPSWFALDQLSPAQVTKSSAYSAIASYFSLGFWHIIPDGVDHLLFLLTIVLGVRTARSLLLSLSAYTLAHTLSYAAATLGWLPASMLNVEPLILLSIVVSALLNLQATVKALWQAAITFGFGLLHGLGFASALGGAGLPTELRLESLLGFNLGVETAQLLCVLLVLPLWWCRRFAWYPTGLRKPGSIVIALVGLGLLYFNLSAS